MKILVVDDSKAIFMMVSQMLEDGGHEAVWAEDGVKACEKLGEMSDIELILLDWNMPNMSGVEFLEKNQAEEVTKAPIVMMTTENKPDYIKRALELGAVEYIMKPFTSDILFNKIELVID
ncbi:response regulator [Halobacteriovorax sp. GB3]|uniref:response regulator n=1 Tax=Halobacteriovorax sp. GB3 TaxID=2719615 RepID=UPI00235FB6F5|nr:response regulator [Halobacteriovorax sp. GB3]MDD0854202.1 response regulator [Halobacteriovorax sp. GB3]